MSLLRFFEVKQTEFHVLKQKEQAPQCREAISSNKRLSAAPGNWIPAFLWILVLGTWNLPATSAVFTERPLYFEANCGQADCAAQFVARNSEGIFSLSPTQATITLRMSGTAADVHTRMVRFEFLGANPDARMTGTKELRGKVNYLIGNDPGNWHKSISTFAAVQVEQAYPGINLVHYGNQRQLEYDFIVSPGANPDVIAFRIEGADGIEIDAQGNLILRIGADEIQQKRPILYQTENGKRKQIEGGYRLIDSKTVAFQIGYYNRAIPLVIDPVLSYSTLIGGLATDAGRAVALDKSGNVYVAGDTLSSQLSIGNVFQSNYAGGYPEAGGDAFVAKFDPTGTNLIYLTYLGGNGNDEVTSLALDPDGNVYITGGTDSTNFPIPSLTVSNRLSGKGGLYFGLHPFDAFVAKLSGDGSQLIYATYLGGSARDEGLGIAVDPNYCAYVTGFTESTNFPTTSGAFQKKFQGVSDAFVTKIASNGMSFVYSTFLGGADRDRGQSIAIDPLGRAFVTGSAFSTNFPVSSNAFQTNGPALALASVAFVSIIESDGSSVAQSTFIGGLGNTVGLGIALDNSGSVTVTGSEIGTGFPITPGTINPGGIFTSANGAGSWSPSNLGLLHNEVHAIGIDPVNPSNVYVGTGRGIARSTNAGASWEVSLDTFDEVVTFAVDPLQPSVIYAGANQVLKSTNSGVSWFSSNTGLPKSVTNPTNTFVTINKLVIDPLSPETLYAGTESGIFKTINAGTNWHSANAGLNTLAVKDLAVDPSNPAILYAATTNGVYNSTNNGSHWRLFSQGLTNLAATAVAVDSGAVPTAYLGLADGSLFKRQQSGTNWVLLSTGLISTNSLFTNVPLQSVTLLAIDPTIPTTLYAGTRGGLFKSTDAGTNWTVVTNGLPDLPVAALGINPVSSSTLYVGTFNYFAGMDAFVTRFNSDLSSIAYSVTLGGSGTDQGVGLALDNGGNAYIVGSTTSLDFPTFQPIGYPYSFNSGSSDAFVAVVKSDGSDFLYSTYLGGSRNDFGNGIALDAANNAWVAGQTFSPDFPIAGGSGDLRGPSDAFLARISNNDVFVDVTLQTTPPGIALFVDGATNSTPATFHWPVGSFHSIAAVPQIIEPNVQYAWTSWSDGGNFFHTITALANTTITANFKLQYYLAMGSTNITVTATNLAVNATNSGGLAPFSGWYDAGTNLIITAIPPFDDTFEGWVGAGAGSFTGTNNPAVVTLNGPISETALFSGPLTNRLRLVIIGKGSVSPNHNGASLKVGKTYTLTATPAAGYVFSAWTGTDFEAQTQKFTFVMTNGLVIKAEFVPTPFPPVAGTYAGLFYDTNVIAFESSGFISATITTQGMLSAKMQLAGKTISFSGHFTPDGLLSATVARANQSSLAITLQLDLSNTNDLMTGQVRTPIWRAELLANRAVYSKANPPPQAGNKYTLLLPGGVESLTEPAGDGYGTVAVDSSGNLNFSGKLGDGTSVAQKTFISKEGQWPLYVSLYSAHGFIIGWLDFTNEPNSDLGGTVAWLKMPRPFTSSYTSGFAIQSESVGSLYFFTNGTPVLPLNEGKGELVLENGKLTESFTNLFVLGSDNKVTSTNKMTLSITTASGLFKGTAVDPVTGKTLSFNGAVLQKQNRGAGFFLQSDQTGRVLLNPQF